MSMLHIPIVHDVSKQIPQEKNFHRVENVIKQLVHALAVHLLRYEAFGKFGEHSMHLLCSPNFPHASYLDKHMLTYKPIVNHIMGVFYRHFLEEF